MPDIRCQLIGGLSEDNIEQMHQAALDLCRSVGLRVPHQGIRERALRHDGVAVRGDDLLFSPPLVESALAQLRYPDSMWQADFQVVSGAYELNVLDLDTDEIRPATLDDLRLLTKLQDALGFVGSAPVRPTDVPEPLQEIMEYKVTWENSRWISGTHYEANEKSTPESAEFIYEMAQAAGKPFRAELWIKSPFRTAATELEIIHRFLDRGVPMYAATMPIAGATAPLFWPGAYVQSMAELWSGLALLHALNPDVPVQALVIDSIRAYPFDMKNASFVYGSPQDVIATLFQVQLNAHYRIPLVAKSLLTNACWPDAQAAAEKAAHTMAAALAGARIFTNAGLLAIDEIYSAEQAVIDAEIVAYCRDVCKPVRFDAQTLAVEAIEDVGIGGSFISHDSTLDHWQETAERPIIFQRPSFSQWLAGGKASLRDRARARARELIADHTYSLPDDIQKDLDRLLHRARKTLLH
jgi:trimethylamine--corrinoid protein Co-methyltransferase